MKSAIRTMLCVATALLAVCAGAQEKPAAPMAATTVQPTQPPANVSSTPKLQSRNPRYELNAGDVIDLVFTYTPEFNQTVEVQPDGFISLRGVGEVHIAGQTVPQVSTVVAKAYGNILHDPEVSVVLKEFEKPHFVVGGEVGRPGKYELRSDTTVMEAVAIAGGLTPRSKHSQVLVFRRVSRDWYEVHKLDLKKIEKGEVREDVHLHPGDMVFVPQNKISKIAQFLPRWGLTTYTSPKQY